MLYEDCTFTSNMTPHISNNHTDAPSVVQQPQNDSILTDAPYTLDVVIDGAPFPEVVWKKDGKPVNYTDDVFVTGYDASLMFAIVTNSDGGVYSVTLTNSEDTVISDSITLSVTGEYTLYKTANEL